MRKLIISSALSILMGAGGMFAAGTAPVSAQELRLDLSGRDGPTIRLRDRCDPRYERCGDRRDGYDRREDRRDRREDRRDRREARVCSEGRALEKAERMGLRRARIESAGRRSIEVRGRARNGERVIVSIGRAPNCPVLY
ncbi:hypothetical protein ABFT80_07020 [Mesorhizobium sp. SB112]|uniref:hypothetical protein n=1 Tax=Mesorhizobium sp. SB112 TaxID=3151853 RepID=UPI003264D5A3